MANDNSKKKHEYWTYFLLLKKFNVTSLTGQDEPKSGSSTTISLHPARGTAAGKTPRPHPSDDQSNFIITEPVDSKEEEKTNFKNPEKQKSFPPPLIIQYRSSCQSLTSS